MESFGEFLKKYRNKKRISQEALAEHLHVSRQTISNWENNKNFPNMELLNELCEFLGFEFSDVSYYLKNKNLEMIINNNKKNYHIKIIMCLLMVTLIIMIVLFSYLFFNYTNKFEVYELELESNDPNITLSNSIFIKSKIEDYFTLGNFDYKSDGNVIINKLKIYDSYTKKVYFEATNSSSLKLSQSSKDNNILNQMFFNKENISVSINIYIDGKLNVIVGNLKFNKIFGNDKFFYPDKTKNVIEHNDGPLTNEIDLSILEQNGYIYDIEQDFYYKKISNDTFIDVNDICLTYRKSNNNFEIMANIFFNDSKKLIITRLDYLDNKFDWTYTYDIAEENGKCKKGKCEVNKSLISLIIDEYNLIAIKK